MLTSLPLVFLSRLEDPEYRRKFIHTLILFYAFINVGICNSITGPSLLDLQIITNTDTEQAAFFITGSSVGSMVGSLLLGVLFGRMDKILLMSATLLGAAVMVTAIPWSSNYVLMIVLHGLAAFFRAIYTSAGNADVISTWEAERRVFLQTLHFCFALGGLLSPLITQPFLAPKMNETSSTVNSSHNKAAPETRVQYAYMINGIMFLIAALLIIPQRFCYNTHEVKTSESKSRYESLDKPLPKTIYGITLTLLLLIFFFIVTIETSISSFILTFVVTYLNWSKSDGARLTSVFWGFYAACRFAAIFYTQFIPPFLLLLVTSCMMMAASVGCLVSSIYKNDVGIWMCVGLGGLSLASQFPSTMAWCQESIIRLSPTIVSLIICACTVPGMVMPAVIGYLIQDVDPLYLFYLLTVECVILLLVYVSMYAWNRTVVQPAMKRLKGKTTIAGDDDYDNDDDDDESSQLIKSS